MCAIALKLRSSLNGNDGDNGGGCAIDWDYAFVLSSWMLSMMKERLRQSITDYHSLNSKSIKNIQFYFYFRDSAYTDYKIMFPFLF